MWWWEWLNVVELSCLYWISYTRNIWAHLFLQVGVGKWRTQSFLAGCMWNCGCVCTSVNLRTGQFTLRCHFALASVWKGRARRSCILRNSTWLWLAGCADTLLEALDTPQFCLTVPFLWLGLRVVSFVVVWGVLFWFYDFVLATVSCVEIP